MLAAIGAFALLIAALGASWWWFSAGDRFTAPLPLSIAVLPFNNLGDDPDQEIIAAGVSIDLTTDLSRIPGAFVIAHGTAQSFKGQNVDARQVGRDLNVRYVIEGSLRRSGNEVRIDVGLIEAGSGRHLWTERFTLERNEIAAWQDEIVGRIASALNFRLARVETERTLRERRDYPDAYDLTTQGWALIYTAKSPENYDAARKLFRQALERNPGICECSRRAWLVLSDLGAQRLECVTGRRRGSCGGERSLDCSSSTQITSSAIMYGVSYSASSGAPAQRARPSGPWRRSTRISRRPTRSWA